jgi:hypothetical protein
VCQLCQLCHARPGSAAAESKIAGGGIEDGRQAKRSSPTRARTYARVSVRTSVDRGEAARGGASFGLAQDRSFDLAQDRHPAGLKRGGPNVRLVRGEKRGFRLGHMPALQA